MFQNGVRWERTEPIAKRDDAWVYACDCIRVYLDIYKY